MQRATFGAAFLVVDSMNLPLSLNVLHLYPGLLTHDVEVATLDISENEHLLELLLQIALKHRTNIHIHDRHRLEVPDPVVVLGPFALSHRLCHLLGLHLLEYVVQGWVLL